MGDVRKQVGAMIQTLVSSFHEAVELPREFELGLSSFARLNEVDVLITDDLLPPEAHAQLADHVGEVIMAESVPTSQLLRASG